METTRLSEHSTKFLLQIPHTAHYLHSTVIRTLHSNIPINKETELLLLLQLQNINLPILLQILHILTIVVRSRKTKRYRGLLKESRTIHRGPSWWIKDYLAVHSVYSLKQYPRRFAVPRSLFWKMRDDLLQRYQHIFAQKQSAFGKVEHAFEIKVLTSLRFLFTSSSYEDLDDGTRMRWKHTMYYLQCFFDCIL